VPVFSTTTGRALKVAFPQLKLIFNARHPKSSIMSLYTISQAPVYKSYEQSPEWTERRKFIAISSDPDCQQNKEVISIIVQNTNCRI